MEGANRTVKEPRGGADESSSSCELEVLIFGPILLTMASFINE